MKFEEYQKKYRKYQKKVRKSTKKSWNLQDKITKNSEQMRQVQTEWARQSYEANRESFESIEHENYGARSIDYPTRLFWSKHEGGRWFVVSDLDDCLWSFWDYDLAIKAIESGDRHKFQQIHNHDRDKWES